MLIEKVQNSKHLLLVLMGICLLPSLLSAEGISTGSVTDYRTDGLVLVEEQIQAAGEEAGGSDTIYEAAGFNPFRDTLGVADFERVDPFTGGLFYSFEDMRLPGNGGLDLVIQRTFNSKNVCGSWYKPAGKAAACRNIPTDWYREDSWAGLGWSLHMGKIIVSSSGINIEMPDGSIHAAYNRSGGGYITRDLWKLDVVGGIYVLTMADGRKITFGHFGGAIISGQLYEYFATRIEDVNGNAIAISYWHAFNNTPADYEYYAAIYSITDSVGRITYFNLTPNTIAGRYRLASIRRPDNEYIRFEYVFISSSNRALLARVTPPVGNSWQFYYTGATNLHQPLSIITPYGGRIDYVFGTTFSGFTIGYEKNFQTVNSKTVSGRGLVSGTWYYNYFQGSTKDYTVINDPCGRVITYLHYGYESGLLSGSYWALGLLRSKNIAGEVTETYSWTRSPAVSNDIYSLPNCDPFTCAPLPPLTDPDIFAPYLYQHAIYRGGKSYITSYNSFDVYGNPLNITEAGDQTRTKNITYWAYPSKNIIKGKPYTITVTGTGGFTGSFMTQFNYDANARPIQENRYGIITQHTYFTSGNLGSTTDPNNNPPTTYQWTNGVISKITNPVYSIARSSNVMGTIASETNGRGYLTAYTYDDNLRPTSVTPPAGAGNPTSISYVTDNSYKTESRGGYWLRTYFDGLGRTTGTVDSSGVTTNIAWKACGLKAYAYSNIGDTVYFDNFGRSTSIVHQDGNAITYTYSGNTITVTDEAGKNTTLNYTAFGRPDDKMLTSITDAKNNITSYTRNILGSLTEIKQGLFTRSYKYDSKNFLIEERNPEIFSTTYGRDDNGNMTRKWDVVGYATYTNTFTYDQINRLKEIDFGSNTITYGYDNANNRTSMTSPGATASYAYDAVNRMTSQSKTISGRAFTTSYGYDGNDNLTNLIYPKGLALTYGYNSNNQLISATGFGGSVSGLTYNTAGLPTGFSYSNGKTTALSYNTRNMTTQINAGTAYNTGFGYDSRGNTTSITDNLPATPVLTHKIDPSKGQFQTTNYRYENIVQNNQLTSIWGDETADYDYNDRGDMTSITENGTTYTSEYDLLHNLTAYKQGTTTIASYGYDGDRLRVTKEVGGTTTVYHHDKSGKLLSETDTNGNRIADYVYVNGNMAAKVDNAGAVSYYHVDPAGTPTAITDSAGNLTWRAEYLPFGEEQILVNTKVNDKMFVGKEKDKETGLYYFGARYMQDKNARFVSVDPVGPVNPASSKTNGKMLLNPQLLNRYAYALNNPYKYVDPDGRVVMLTSHSVFLAIRHTALLMIPDNQSLDWGSKRFKKNKAGKWYATLSAGPDSVIDPKLKSDLNRPTDDIGNNTIEGIVVNPYGVTAQDDTLFINTLIEKDSKYSDQLDYDLIPMAGADGYNSNSYVPGLLNAADADTPSTQTSGSYPGLSKPVPEEQFE